VKRIHIVGRKNSGKTTLIVDLVSHLSARGMRVGTIKHTHHQHELDTPGKDSYLHRQAGAAAVGILSPGLNAVFLPHVDEHDSPDQYARLAPLFDGCDLVLVEGHSKGMGKKVEVWRTAAQTSPLYKEDDSILAIITDDQIETEKPVWPRANIAQLADHILTLLAD